ncbi:hypothetical protein EST38_g14064 [Candolleomyces aberdarensis]|uniref:Uncharacterized protein n=1 Tax=Candolleomyces aberdarensis TaxID=2316362 RepID=A0A4Q2D0M8_9AGAR|nr:hypothetical protein EST38_g14064 [Candolleomyces aberdarensis]
MGEQANVQDLFGCRASPDGVSMFQATLRLKDEMLGKNEKTLSALVSLLESTKKEVESLKKEQAAVSRLVKDQLEVTKGGTREMKEDLDRLKQFAINCGGTSSRSLVDLNVYLNGRTPGLDAEYKAMERSVFDINQAGLIWLTNRPVWHSDGVQVSYIRFTALIEGEKVSLDELREGIVKSHKRIWKCDAISILKL